MTHPNLRAFAGDVLDAAAVAASMPGHDAVVICLGRPARKAGTLRSEGTRNIIAAMQAHGVPRLICQSSLGFGDSRNVLKSTSLVFRFVIVPLLLADTFRDHARQETLVKDSGLDWTIVRPGNMTNGPLTENYHHGFQAHAQGLKVKVSRADVSHFILRQIQDRQYSRKAAGISY